MFVITYISYQGVRKFYGISLMWHNNIIQKEENSMTQLILGISLWS